MNIFAPKDSYQAIEQYSEFQIEGDPNPGLMKLKIMQMLYSKHVLNENNLQEFKNPSSQK